MKKFLKHTLAVLLVVCMMASIMAPVSAITPTTNTTSGVETVTENYEFKSAVAYSAYANNESGTPVLVSGQSFGNWSFMYTSRTTSSGTCGVGNSYTYLNMSCSTVGTPSHYLVLKLNNIKYAGEYTLAFKTNTKSQFMVETFLLPGNTTISSSAEAKAWVDTTSTYYVGQVESSSVSATTTTLTYTITEQMIVDNSVVLLMTNLGDSGDPEVPATSTRNLNLVSLATSVDVNKTTTTDTYTYSFADDRFTDGTFYSGDKNINICNGGVSSKVAAAYAEGSLDWSFVGMYEGYLDSGDVLYNANGYLNMRLAYQYNDTNTDYPFAAIRLAGVDKAGLYSISFTNYHTANTTYNGSVFMLPAGELDEYVAKNLADSFYYDEDGAFKDGLNDNYAVASAKFACEYINSVIDDDTYRICDRQSFKVKGSDSNEKEFAMNDTYLEADKEYIMVFRAEQGSGNTNGTPKTSGHINPVSVTMTLNVTDNSYVASANGEYFATFAEAAIAAGENGTVTLLDDVSNITLGAGQTLDLNGHNVANDSLSLAANNNQIVDSYYHVGKVVANNVDFTGNNAIALKNGDGYSFFTYEVKNFGEGNPYAFSNGSYGFWFDINFDNISAYKLIAGNNSGFEVTANLTVSGSYSLNQDYSFSSVVVAWADASKCATDDLSDAGAKNENGYGTMVDYSLCIVVSGIDTLTAGDVVTVTPSISVNGAAISFDAITYNV